MKNKNLRAKIKDLYSKNSVPGLENPYHLNEFVANVSSYDKYDRYDQSEPYKFSETQPSINEVPRLCHISCFLYHGIRFQNYLEKLEKIFEKRAILASKYIDNCFSYEDNCNDGEYVSLLEIDDPWEYDAMYEAFIRTNITLVVSPFCEAYNTIFVSFHEWEEIRNSGRTFKNRFSYGKNEYQVKDYVPIDQVVAIGVPFLYLTCNRSEEYAKKLLEDVIMLMHKYELDLPVIDTSNYNKTLYVPELEEARKLVP